MLDLVPDSLHPPRMHTYTFILCISLFYSDISHLISKLTSPQSICHASPSPSPSVGLVVYSSLLYLYRIAVLLFGRRPRLIIGWSRNAYVLYYLEPRLS